MTNLTRSPEALGTVAANITMNASADYIRRNNLTVTDYETTANVIRDYCKRAVLEALEDAKEALETGMDHVAEATFQATMKMAGIEAVKKLIEDEIAV